MEPTIQRVRVRRATPSGRSRVVRPRPPEPTIGKPVDARTFLSQLRRKVAAGVVVAFGAFYGLTALNAVGVTAHATAPGGPVTSVATPALVLPPGDFFGQPGDGQALTQPVGQPQLIIGGGQPMLQSGGS
jgi:hypothetical protein